MFSNMRTECPIYNEFLSKKEFRNQMMTAKMIIATNRIVM